MAPCEWNRLPARVLLCQEQSLFTYEAAPPPLSQADVVGFVSIALSLSLSSTVSDCLWVFALLYKISGIWESIRIPSMSSDRLQGLHLTEFMVFHRVSHTAAGWQRCALA